MKSRAKLFLGSRQGPHEVELLLVGGRVAGGVGRVRSQGPDQAGTMVGEGVKAVAAMVVAHAAFACGTTGHKV